MPRAGRDPLLGSGDEGEEGDDGGGRDNDAIGWYVEGQYSFPGLPWTPKLIYRYIRLSGDEADTPENEEYRGLFYTIFKRDWDTWFQGEIAGLMTIAVIDRFEMVHIDHHKKKTRPITGSSHTGFSILPVNLSHLRINGFYQEYFVVLINHFDTPLTCPRVPNILT